MRRRDGACCFGGERPLSTAVDEAGDNVQGGSCGARRRWLGSPGGLQLHSRRRRVLRDGPETTGADVRRRRRRDRAANVRPGGRGRRPLGAPPARAPATSRATACSSCSATCRSRSASCWARSRAASSRSLARRPCQHATSRSVPGSRALLVADRRPQRRGRRRRRCAACSTPSSTCSSSTRPQALLKRCRPVAPTEVTAADHYPFVLHTSGVTKEPKGVAHTHAATYAARMQAKHWLDVGPGDIVWCTAGNWWGHSIWNVLGSLVARRGDRHARGRLRSRGTARPARVPRGLDPRSDRTGVRA